MDFWKLWNCLSKTWAISKFQKSWGLSQELPKPSMWLLVNHTKPKHFVLNLLSFGSRQLQISQRAITKIVGNCKITSITMQYWLQSILWLLQRFCLFEKQKNLCTFQKSLFQEVLKNMKNHFFPPLGTMFNIYISFGQFENWKQTINNKKVTIKNINCKNSFLLPCCAFM